LQSCAHLTAERDKTLRTIPAFLVLLTLGPPAGLAAEPTPTPSTEKIICKIYPVTGSRIKKRRVCATEAEWFARGINLAIEIDQSKDRGTVKPQLPGAQ